MFITLFIAIPLCSIYANSIYDVTRDTISSFLTENGHRTDITDEISSLTLAINTVNNILTYASFIIALLTFATILAGFFGYKKLEKKVVFKTKEMDEKLKEIEEFKKQVTEAHQLLENQNSYIQFANNYLYQTTEQIINQMNDSVLAMEIYKTLSHNYHVANLYSIDKDIRFAALAYLREKGELSDIEHLQKVSINDTEERFRNMAKEIIGTIKYRMENEKNIND